jgi:hypothetical protein
MTSPEPLKSRERSAGHAKTPAEALHLPGAAEIELNTPKSDWMPKPAEFD